MVEIMKGKKGITKIAAMLLFLVVGIFFITSVMAPTGGLGDKIECGDSICSIGENEKTCEIDCNHGCGDGICDEKISEDNKTCPSDCFVDLCGNDICDEGEDLKNCEIDCMPKPVITRTASSERNCLGGVCNLVVYSGTNFIYEDETWKTLGEAKSWKNSNIKPIYLEDDGVNVVKVLDYNSTSIIVQLETKEILTKDYTTDLKIWDVSSLPEKDGKSQKVNKDNFKEGALTKSNIVELSEVKQSDIKVLDFGLGKVLEFGKNSTTIILQDANSENMDDTWVSSNNPDDEEGSQSYIRVGKDIYNDLGRGYFKFNLSQLDIGVNIYLGANFSIYNYNTGTSTHRLLVSEVYQDNWTEETLTWNNQLCGTAFNNNTACNLTSLDNKPEGNDDTRVIFNILPILSKNIGSSDNMLSLVVYNDTANEANFNSKESTGTSNDPLLNITYTIGFRVNTLSNNQQVFNTKSLILNTSQYYYNNSVRYTYDNGKTNVTLCNNSQECQTILIFPYQGYYNLTVYANSSLNEQVFQTISNIFVGNNTLIYPSDDSYVMSSEAGSNYGTGTSMRVGYYNSVYKYSILKFGLSPVQKLNTILLDSVLGLNFYSFDNPPYTVPDTMNINLLYNNYSWSETGVTYNNRPTTYYGTPYTSTITVNLPTSTYYYSNILNATNFVFSNRYSNLSLYLTSGVATYFYTRENSGITYDPFVNFTYYTPPIYTTLESPVSGGYYNQNLNISFTPNSNSTATYKITLQQLTGPTNKTISNNIYPSTSYLWNSTNVSNGVYRIWVEVIDDIGQSYSVSSGNITIDNTPPIAVLNTPANGTLTNTIGVNFTTNFTDPLNTTSMISSCYQEFANVSTVCGGLDSGTYSVSNPADWSGGPVSEAYDGNWGSNVWANPVSYIDINYTKPLNSINVTWQTKSTGTGLQNISIPLSCFNYYNDKILLRLRSAQASGAPAVGWYCYSGSWDLLLSDNTNAAVYEEAVYWGLKVNENGSGIKNATINIYNSTGIFNQTTISYSPGVLTTTVGIVVQLADNIYSWFFRVFDWGGNSYTTENRTIEEEGNPPVIVFYSPINNTGYINENVLLNYTASDSHLDSCWYSFNGGINTSLPGCTTTSLVAQQDWNTLILYSNDTIGNLGTNVVSFVVDSVYPTIDYNGNTETGGVYVNRNNIFVNITVNEIHLRNTTIFLYNSTNNLVTSYVSLVTNFTYNFTSLSDGFYKFNATTCDLGYLCNSTATRNITLDTTPPQISIGEGTLDSGVNVSQVNIYVNLSLVETNFANMTFYLYNDTSVVNSTTYTTPTYNINWTNLPVSNYSYQVNVTDIVNLKNATIMRTIWLDNSTPNAILTIPSNNSYLNSSDNNYTVSLTDTGTGIKNATLNIYNTTTLVNQTTVTFAPNTLTTTLGIVVTLTDNVYRWFYNIFDWAGNSFNTNNNTLTIDTTNPVVTIVYPQNNTGYIMDITILNYTVSDVNLNTTSCYYSTDLGITNTSVPGGCSSNITTLTSTQGDNYWFVCAVDVANNIKCYTSYFAIDSVYTNISYNSNTEIDNSYIAKSSIFINVSAVDAHLKNISIYLYNVSNVKINSSNSTLATFVYNFTSLPDGVYRFNATACDLGSLCNSTATRSITIDTIKPLIAYNSGTQSNGANKSQTFIYVNVTLTEINFANMTFTLRNATDQINSTIFTSATYSINWTGLPDGSYTYWVNVTDLANNKNDTGIRSIRLDTTSPSGILLLENNLYSNNSMNNFTINLSDNILLCYQESANVSTSCGGLNTGIYGCDTNWASSCDSVLYDGDWDTYTSTPGNKYSNFYINYTVPNSINLALWQIKHFGDDIVSTNNYTIPNNCLNDELQLYITNSANGIGEGTQIGYCKNITDWQQLYRFDGVSGDTRIYEEAVIWSMNNSFSSGIKNVTLNVWNSTSLVNQTIVTFSSNIISTTLGVIVTLTDDIYTWFYQIFDWAGNNYITDNNTVTIDTTLSLIAFDSGTQIDGANKSQTFIYVNVTLTEINFANMTFTLRNATSEVNSITYTVPTYNINWTSLPNTNYTYWVNITDLANNKNTTGVRNIRLDTVNPNATLLLPSNNSYTNMSINNFTVSIIDNESGIGIKNVTLNIWNATSLVNQTTIIYTPNIFSTTLGIVVTLTDNVYRWFYQVFDWAGNNYITENNTVTIDITRSLIAFDTGTQSNGANKSQTFIYVNVTLTEINFANMTFTLRNATDQINSTIFTSVTYSINWTGLPDGSYTYLVNVTDLANNKNDTGIRNIELDTIKPLIAFDTGTQSNGANKSQTFIYVNVTLTEINFANMTFTLRNATDQINSTIFTSATYSINWTGLSDGIYTYWVNVTDSANNKNDTGIRNIILDDTNPNITLLTPINNTKTNITLNNYTANITDNLAGIKNISIIIYNSTSGVVNQTTRTYGEGILETLVGIPITLADGIYRWLYTVFDYAGNFLVSNNNTISIDTSASVITFVDPTAPNDAVRLSRDYILVNVTISDLLNVTNVTFNLRNSTGDLINSTTYYGPAPYYINWSGLPIGVYRYNVTTRDEVNNFGTTDSRYITLDLPAGLHNLRLENIDLNNVSVSYTPDSNLIWVTTYVYTTSGVLIDTDFAATSFRNSSFLHGLAENTEYVFKWQTGTLLSESAIYNFTFRTKGWMPELDNWRYKRLITVINGSLVGEDINGLINVSLNETNFVYGSAGYSDFVNINYTTGDDIRIADYYEQELYDYDIEYINVPGIGGQTTQSLANATNFTGVWFDPNYCHDGDWGTSCKGNPYGEQLFNYTIPTGATNNSLLRMYTGDYYYDKGVAKDCYGGTDLAFKADQNYTGPTGNGNITVYCQNASGTGNWIYVWKSESKLFYDSMMIWNYQSRMTFSVKPKHILDDDYLVYDGTDAGYPQKMWLYYGNGDAVANETVLTGNYNPYYTLGSRTTYVASAPIIIAFNNSIDRNLTSTTFNWSVNKIATNILYIATNQWMLNISYVPYNTTVNYTDASNITFIFNGADPNITYYYRAVATADGLNDTETGSFVLGTLGATPTANIIESSYNEDRSSKKISICANLTDLNGEANVNLSIQYWNENSTDFNETNAISFSDVGSACWNITLEYGQTYHYRSKAQATFSGYSSVYTNEFMALQDFFVGSYIDDDLDYRQREYCLNGVGTTPCWNQTGTREGSLQEEDWAWIESKITEYGNLTLKWFNGVTWNTYSMNYSYTDAFFYYKITGLTNNWHTMYIVNATNNVILNWTKPILGREMIGSLRLDGQKYVSFNTSHVNMSYAIAYFGIIPNTKEVTSSQYCQNNGGDLFSCMSGASAWGTYWGTTTPALPVAWIGTAYDRGELPNGGVWDGGAWDTGILVDTPPTYTIINNSPGMSAGGSQPSNSTGRGCYAFADYTWNMSYVPSNNITNYYYRFWTQDQWVSTYYGYPQSRRFDNTCIKTFNDTTGTWNGAGTTGCVANTNILNEIRVKTVNNLDVFSSGFNQTLVVGYRSGMNVDTSKDKIYDTMPYFDAQWTNQMINQYQQAFIIYNIPDNTTLIGMDSDIDGVNDYAELFTYYTNPFVNDTDMGGKTDGVEIAAGSDPTIYNDDLYINLISPENNSLGTILTVNFTADINAQGSVKSINLTISNASEIVNTTTYFYDEGDLLTAIIGIPVTLINGIYQWFYEMFDWTGASTTSNVYTLYLDNNFPRVELLSPMNNSATNNNTILFNCNITSAIAQIDNITLFTYSPDGTERTNFTDVSGNQNTTLLWISFPNTEGLYKWNCYASGVNGLSGWGVEGNYTFIMDFRAPNITLLLPENDTYINYGTDINLTVRLNDSTGIINSGLSNATVRVYDHLGALIVETKTSFNHDIYRYDFGTLVSTPDDVYYWMYETVDFAGNIIQSESRKLTVDTIYPIINIVSPTFNQYLNYTSIFINYTITDIHLDACWWHLNNGGNTSIICGNNFTVNILTVGQNNITVYINDTAGNINASKQLFFVDIMQPNATLSYPGNNSYLNYSNNINLTVNLSDNHSIAGLSNVSFYLFNSANTIINQTNISFVSGLFDTTLGLMFNLVDDVYTWFVTTMDFAGNWFKMGNKTFTVDTTQSLIDYGTNTAPNGFYNSSTAIWVDAVLTEINFKNITYRLATDVTHGYVNYTTYDVYSPFTIFANFAGLSNGEYWYNITVCDLAHNCNITATRNITLDTLRPSIHYVANTEANNSYLNRTFINITVSVNDTHIFNTTIKVYYQNGTIQNSTEWIYKSSGSFNINDSGLLNGNYTFNASTCDIASNCNTTAIYSIVIDTVATNVSISYPLQNHIYASEDAVPASIIFKYDDWSSADTCYFEQAGSSSYTTSFACPAQSVDTTVAVPAVKPDGIYKWRIFVTDKAGNKGYKEVNFTINRSNVPTIDPISPGGSGGSSDAEDQWNTFNATITGPLNLSNTTLYIYNTTNFSQPPYYQNRTDYLPGVVSYLWESIIWFVRGTYYWWFDTYDSYTNYVTTNVSNYTVNMAELYIISPLNNSRNFSYNDLVLVTFNSTQASYSCKYSINGAANFSILPLNSFLIAPVQGANTVILYCRNNNGTGWTSVNFDYYVGPRFNLRINTPKNGQYYRDVIQPLDVSYNTSWTIPYLNYSINGAPYKVFNNGQKITWPQANNILRVTARASPPYAFPYDAYDVTGYEETVEIRFTMGDKVTGAFTDMMLYFWAFLFFGMLAIVFAYLKNSEDAWQFFMRTVWYTMEMLIGFGVIVESIKFIRAITGTGG